MEREKKLIKNTVVLTIGKICTQLITFFLLPLYTSILSTEEYGIVDLLNVLVSLFLPLITLKLEEALFRELIDSRSDENKKRKIISTGVITVIIQVFICIVLYFIYSSFIKNEYSIFLVINVIAYVFSVIFQQIARGLGKNENYSIACLICAIVTIIINVFLLLKVHLGAKGLLLGTMMGQLACTIYILYSCKVYKYIDLHSVDVKLLKVLWKYSFPLIPSVLSWWIFNSSDRMIVSIYLGVGQNGIMSAAHKFSTVYITLFSVFNMSWTESVSTHINDKDIEKYFNDILNVSLKIFSAIGIGIIACMPFIYPVMIDDKFWNGFYQVPIMMVSSILNVLVSMLAAIYIAKRETKTPAKIAVLAAIINIITHLILIKFIGLYAATISTLLAYIAILIHRLNDIKNKYFNIVIDRKMLIKTLLILIIVLTVYYANNMLLNIIGVLIVILYSYDLNSNIIKKIINIIYKKMNQYRS